MKSSVGVQTPVWPRWIRYGVMKEASSVLVQSRYAF
jgi:hypothetical protein